MDDDRKSVSCRARRAIDFPLLLLNAFNMQQANPYNTDTNPDGIVNLGTSENKLCFDLLQQKLNSYSGEKMPEAHTHYSSFHGMPSFQADIAAFFNHFMKPLEPFKADNIFALNGCGSVVDLISYSLCDTGEGLLIPAPYYGGFNMDISLRSECVCYPVHLSSSPRKEFSETKPFKLTVGRMEEALENAKRDGVAIRGLLLTNPNNPFGYIYSQEEVESYMEFASRHDLHFISDEIYMLSIFNESSSMVSASAITTSLPKNKLHIVWGFSKDFGVSGFRCGTVHTTNLALAATIKNLAYFKSVPATTQTMLQLLITDFNWIENVYVTTVHKRLRESYNVVVVALKELSLEFIPSVAGFFVWVDFRKFISPHTEEKEMEFFMEMIKHGVYLVPSQAFFGNEIGWMRIIFSVPPIQCEIAMRRLKSFLAVENQMSGLKIA